MEGNLPRRGRRRELGTIRSPVLAEIAEATNVYSNNFLAEMLMKNLGAEFRRRGSTAAGTRVVEAFAGNHRSAVHAVDGSGLTRGNRASPAGVAHLIDSMREVRGAAAFIDSLAIAGREGTIASRMGGTAAAGRCHAKTGTISGVSALSGICFNRSGRKLIFSVLNNGVSNLSAAHAGQDRIAVLVAQR
jgi:D-alanyl-D-alanine carboxypeptidase/D-alanyl-D-alanine-endopeptidase (penicillin-binding protein 4)